MVEARPKSKKGTRRPQTTPVGAKRKNSNDSASPTKKLLTENSLQSESVSNFMGSVTYVPDREKTYLASQVSRREISRELSMSGSPLFPLSRERFAQLGPEKRRTVLAWREMNSKKRSRSATRGKRKIKKKEEDEDPLYEPRTRPITADDTAVPRSPGVRKRSSNLILKLPQRAESVPVMKSVRPMPHLVQRPATVQPRRRQSAQTCMESVRSSPEKSKGGDYFKEFLESQNVSRLFKGGSKRKILMEDDYVVMSNTETLRLNSREAKMEFVKMSPRRLYENQVYYNTSNMKILKVGAAMPEKSYKAFDTLKNLKKTIFPTLDGRGKKSGLMMKGMLQTTAAFAEIDFSEMKRKFKCESDDEFHRFLSTINYDGSRQQ